MTVDAMKTWGKCYDRRHTQSDGRGSIRHYGSIGKGAQTYAPRRQYGTMAHGESVEGDGARRYCQRTQLFGHRRGAYRWHFCLLETPEPNYARILGAWRNDEAYLTLHRVAADPAVHGLARAMFAFAEKRAREQGIYNLRIDTHKMNQGMQRVIRKAGFVHCGVIHLADGAPREAFQKIVKNEPRETEK